jgi:hypothetical protein
LQTALHPVSKVKSNVDKIRFSSNKELIRQAVPSRPGQFMNMVVSQASQLPSLHYPEIQGPLLDKIQSCRAFIPGTAWRVADMLKSLRLAA